MTNSPQPFVTSAYSSFRFASYGFDERTGLISLHYALDDRIRFVEHVQLPNPPYALSTTVRRALDRLLWLLHLAAGVSYYKTAAPRRLLVETGPVPADVATFLASLYREGLAEFAWNNRLDLSFVAFPSDVDAPHTVAPSAGLAPRSIVPIGGGKDSAVTVEALRCRAESPVLFSVGDAAPITRTASVARLPHLVARRTISANLKDLNGAGAYNGHVPVTAIVSLIACAVALVEDHRHVVMSNERSASVGTDLGDGVIVNHQYSKGFAFETGLREVLRAHVAADLQYFSLLRPFSELAIARAFAGLPQYWAAITSCNRAFRIDTDRRVRGWCGDCPKCRFVFLALAPFMPKPDLIGMLGKNLLDDPEQIDGYGLLLGTGGPKPFECVGEVDETRRALAMVAHSADWADSHVIRAFASDAHAWLGDPGETGDLFLQGALHHVPDTYHCSLDAILRP